MPQGVEIFADSGYRLLDSNLRNLFLRVKSSAVTQTNNVTQFGASKLVITYTGPTGGMPLPAVGGSTYVMLLTTQVSGTTWTWTYVTEGAVGTTIPYYIFDIPPSGSSLNFGLEAYDASGNITFVSVEKPLRIRHVAVGNMGSQFYGGIVNLDSGRVYAPIQGRFAALVIVGLGSEFNTEALHGYGISTRGATGAYGAKAFKHSQSLDGNYDSSHEVRNDSYELLIADVTNY